MHLTIHGHFYQPPRENPWTGRIPRQPSASPHHDWNERITSECYAPNTRSRVLDPEGRIVEIVDNLASLHFDIGPTLLLWLERERPEVYRRVLDADAASIQRNGGHGNAIAQAYNHMILPLASHRDRRTQVHWGLRDFEHRFGRRSESIWLPETAVDAETVQLLAEFGIRYLILSPHQARRIRPLEGGDWIDVGEARIDPRVPYRLFIPGGRDGQRSAIDLFFYDGPLAHEISFGNLLRSAPSLADRIEAAAGGAGEDMLVHVATDGEVYGHHMPFGDMCLAALFAREAPRRGIVPTNYGRFLDRHPPRHEVELDFGPEGRGTSWSCAHGVGRWHADCGCSTGGPEEWSQQWREPLRAGLDHLRDRLVAIFHEQAGSLVKDPWTARDDSIEILLAQEERGRFLERHARRRLTEADRQRLWRLLESQRQAMLMFTSCAWFFADVSRLEVQQNLAHAARAIDLAQPFTTCDLESELLDFLAGARSNLPAIGTGAEVWRHQVQPMRREPVFFAFAAAGRQAASISEDDAGRPSAVATEVGPVEGSLAGGAFRARVAVIDRATEETHRYQVEARPDAERLLVFSAREEDAARDAPVRCTLDDLDEETRFRIVRAMLSGLLDREERRFDEIFEESLPLLRRCRGLDPILPTIFRSLARHVLLQRCERIAESLGRTDPRELRGREVRKAASGTGRIAESIGVTLPDSPLARIVEEALDANLESVQDVTTEDIVRSIDLLEGAASSGIEIRRTSLEEKVHDLLEHHLPILTARLAGRSVPASEVDPDLLIQLAEMSNLALHTHERTPLRSEHPEGRRSQQDEP